MKISDAKNRRRLPGECPTARQAIRLHCMECCGWIYSEVRRCSAPECWLWLLRGSTYPQALEIAALELETHAGEPFPTDTELWGDDTEEDE